MRKKIRINGTLEKEIGNQTEKYNIIDGRNKKGRKEERVEDRKKTRERII